MEYQRIGEQEGDFVYQHREHPLLFLLLDLSRPVLLRDVWDQLQYQGENVNAFMAQLEAIEGT